ncbi:unnamed protein product [Jaminaea pallidilutea]
MSLVTLNIDLTASASGLMQLLLPSYRGRRRRSRLNTTSRGDEAYAKVDAMVLNTLPPKTEWMNMGFWLRDSDDSGSGDILYPEACENLGRQLYRASGLQLDPLLPPKDDLAILDIGHGSGDSLLLLLEAARPKTLHGVTLSEAEALRARSRLSQSVLRSKGSFQDVAVHQGDAIEFMRKGAAASGEKGQTDVRQQYDYIFALDCAFHFAPPRSAFFQSAYERLKPGGKLALYDMCVSTPYPAEGSKLLWFTEDPRLPRPTRSHFTKTQQLKLWFFSLMVSVPCSNLLSFSDYRVQLEQAGFQDTQVCDISHAVFPGFSHFLHDLAQQHGAESWRAGAGGWSMRTALGAFAGFVADWAKGGDDGLLRSAMIVATKPH